MFLKLQKILPMPNTLVHIVIQTPLTRLGIKKAGLQWIAVGCIIPDIPWIVQRIFTPFTDPLALRLYAVTQASLVYCLILALALSMLTRSSKQIFLILAGNSLFHLLIDATQNKWGNGVNLLVPFSWHTTNFNLLWPEHFSNYILSGAGLLVLLILWPKAINDDLLLEKPCRKKTLLAATCLIFYFASPMALTASAYHADIHYSNTLNDRQTRTGKKIEIDRARYNTDTRFLKCYADKELKFTNLPATHSGSISIRGRFTDQETIELQEYHTHSFPRSLASYTGLLLTLLLWVHSLIRQRTTSPLTGPPNEQ